MRASLLDILIDPVLKSPLTLVDQKTDGGEVTEGKLRSADADSYFISNAIPRLW